MATPLMEDLTGKQLGAYQVLSPSVYSVLLQFYVILGSVWFLVALIDFGAILFGKNPITLKPSGYSVRRRLFSISQRWTAIAEFQVGKNETVVCRLVKGYDHATLTSLPK